MANVDNDNNLSHKSDIISTSISVLVSTREDLRYLITDLDRDGTEFLAYSKAG